MRTQLIAALSVYGVYRVRLVSPAEDRELDGGQWALWRNMTISAARERKMDSAGTRQSYSGPPRKAARRAAGAKRLPRQSRATANPAQEPTERREAFPLGESSSPYGIERSVRVSVMEGTNFSSRRFRATAGWRTLRGSSPGSPPCPFPCPSSLFLIVWTLRPWHRLLNSSMSWAMRAGTLRGRKPPAGAAEKSH